MDAAVLRQSLKTDGYVRLPERLDAATSDAICRRLEHLATTSPGRKALLPDEFFNQFVVHPLMMDYATRVLGPSFMLHHACGRMLRTPGIAKEWHHDYDSENPWEPSLPMMIHFMIYPAGLTMSTGPLLIVPGSHNYRVPRSFPRQYGTGPIEGAVEICGEPGLIVVINSALWHSRSTPLQAPRYDLNVSFCQPGIEWPERKQWTDAFLSVAVQTLRSAAPGNPLSRPGLLVD